MVDQKKQTSVNGADVARMKGLLTTARNSKLPVA